MAVPKTKQSKSRTCHELKVAHRVCKNCGYYDGKEVIAEKEESK